MNYLEEIGNLVKNTREGITNIAIGSGEDDVQVAKDLIILLQDRYGLRRE